VRNLKCEATISISKKYEPGTNSRASKWFATSTCDFGQVSLPVDIQWFCRWLGWFLCYRLMIHSRMLVCSITVNLVTAVIRNRGRNRILRIYAHYLWYRMHVNRTKACSRSSGQVPINNYKDHGNTDPWQSDVSLHGKIIRFHYKVITIMVKIFKHTFVFYLNTIKHDMNLINSVKRVCPIKVFLFWPTKLLRDVKS